jgi:DNA repair protein RadC
MHMRPREQIRQHGPSTLTLEQAVALIVRSGTRTAGVEQVSRNIAQALQQGKRSYAELRTISGVGEATAGALMGALELGVLLDAPQLSDYLITPEAVYRACSDLLHEQQEHLVVFYLNVRNQSVRRDLITLGTASSSIVHPREVFRTAIIANASSLILAHNHPSGDPTPSVADAQVTQRVAEAGRTVGIELLDHVVCARRGFISLKETSPQLFP